MNFKKYSKMPTVGAVMTPFPYFVKPYDSVGTVERIMEKNDIRHVPVQEDGHVIGVITERDLHRLVNPALPAVDKARIRARDVLVAEPWVVGIDMPLDQAVSLMAEHHIGSLIVLKHEKLVGILSFSDVCLVLAEVLETAFPDPGGNDAA